MHFFLANKRFWPIRVKCSSYCMSRKIRHNKKFQNSFQWALERFTMTEMCRMRSSSLAESLAGSSVGSGRFSPPSWWWMWKSSVPFSSHCCLQRTRGMSSELPEISARDNRWIIGAKWGAKWVKLHSQFTISPWFKDTLL